MSNRRPIDLMFGAYRRRILALLLTRPRESFHVREIARLADVPPGSLHRELKVLFESGLLLSDRVGNQVRYRADPEAPLAPELTAIFFKTTGLADPIREALLPLRRSIEAAFVFGSVARGEERSTSDLDVFVVGGVSFARVVGLLAPLRTRLGRELNPVVMTGREFRAKRAQGDRFIVRVAGEAKLFVIGSADDLGEPPTDRPSQVARDGRGGDPAPSRRRQAQSGRRERR